MSLAELRLAGTGLPEEVLRQRKESILSSLRELAPGLSEQVGALPGPGTGQVVMTQEGLTRLLTLHWQHVFDAKLTNRSLRDHWLSRLQSARLTEASMKPTIEDVMQVLE